MNNDDGSRASFPRSLSFGSGTQGRKEGISVRHVPGALLTEQDPLSSSLCSSTLVPSPSFQTDASDARFSANSTGQSNIDILAASFEMPSMLSLGFVARKRAIYLALE